MSPTKVMNHSQYKAMIKHYPIEALKHIIEDCQEVAELQKDFNPNLGYYQDEILYCMEEIARRKKSNRIHFKYQLERKLCSAIDNVKLLAIENNDEVKEILKASILNDLQEATEKTLGFFK